MREGLMRHAHVALTKLQSLNEEMRSFFEILQWNARSVLSRDGHSLEMRDEVMLVDADGVVKAHLGH